MNKIELLIRHASDGNKETVIVENYGLTQAIEQIRVERNYSILVLSAKIIDPI